MTTLRLDLLVRTSRRKKEARSPQQQRDIADACARQHGYEIVHVHDSGRSESGKTMDRASVHAAIDRIRAGATDGVIVALLDRVGRAPIEEAMTFVRELDQIGGCLVPADGGGRPVDLSDPQAESMLVFQLQIARQYWMTKAQGMKRSVADALKAGKFIGPAPLGYERNASRLRPDPVKATVITQAYRAAAQDGVHAAVDYLTAQVPDRQWNTDHARRLLASRVYLGELHYQGYESNLHAHEPLTDLATWTAAQTEPRMRRSNGDYPLSHLVHCQRCGSGMVGALQSVNGRRYRRMRCSAPACRGGSSISADKLEAHVLDVMTRLLARKAFRDQFSPAGLGDAEAAMDATRAERRALTSKVKPSHPDFSAWLADADALVDEATRRFAELSALTDQSETLPQAHELSDPEQFRRGLRALTRVRRIVVAPGRGDVGVRVKVERHDHVAGALAA